MTGNDYGFDPDDIVEPLWTDQDCADDFTAEQRLVEARVRVLHSENAKCAVCKEVIDKPENALHNILSDGTEYLCHDTGTCVAGTLEIMMGRYLTRSEKKVWVA